MAGGSKIQEEAAQALRAWVLGLGEGVARFEDSSSGPIRLIRVVPSRTASASIEFEIGRRSFGLHVEGGIRVEPLPLSVEYLLEICAAVASGHVEEERWMRAGKVVKCHGVLHLPSGDLGGTEFSSILGGTGAESVRHQYEPYAS